MIAVIERIRLRAIRAEKLPWWRRWSVDLRAQLFLLAGLLVVCAVMGLRRSQRRRPDLRYAGEYILRTIGPDRRILARIPEIAYYARGKAITIPAWRQTKLDNESLAAILHESRAELVGSSSAFFIEGITVLWHRSNRSAQKPSVHLTASRGGPFTAAWGLSK